MILLAAVLLPLIIGSAFIFGVLHPGGAPDGRIRTFNRRTWLATGLAVLASIVLTWRGSIGSVDYGWWPVAAAFIGSVVWVVALLGATVLRYVVFRRQRA